MARKINCIEIDQGKQFLDVLFLWKIPSKDENKAQ